MLFFAARNVADWHIEDMPPRQFDQKSIEDAIRGDTKIGFEYFASIWDERLGGDRRVDHLMPRNSLLQQVGNSHVSL
jgi:hypothetical protein